MKEDEISELLGRQKLSNCLRGSYLLYGHYQMRRFARTWIQKYPSIAKINQAIAGPRRMGNERTVEDYVKAIKKFMEFLGESDPEMALRKMRKRALIQVSSTQLLPGARASKKGKGSYSEL